MDEGRPWRTALMSWPRTLSSRFALPIIHDATNLIMEHHDVLFGECTDSHMENEVDDTEFGRRFIIQYGSSFLNPILVLDLIWNLFFVLIAILVLLVSGEASPPLRFWLSFYALQCLFHVFFVFFAYLRGRFHHRAGSQNRRAQDDRTHLQNHARTVKRLEAMNTMIAYIWWVFGFYLVVMGGQPLLEASPKLYWLAVIFLAFDVFFIIFCTGIAFIGFFALCCIIPFVTYGHTVTFLEGASEDEIRSLPKYRFYQNDPPGQFDNDHKQELVMTLEFGYRGHTVEHTLHPDDSACCICLARYIHGVQLCMLPCNHHFHSRCITKWLRLNPTCPLCKFNVRQDDSLV